MGGEELFTVTFEAKTSAKIRKWRVKPGTFVPAGKKIGIATSDPGNKVELSFKCKKAGVVRRLLAKVGDVIEPGYETKYQHFVDVLSFYISFQGRFTSIRRMHTSDYYEEAVC